MRTLLLFPFLFAFFHSRKAQAQSQTNLYVDSSAAASGVGTSWSTAYKTLNEALNLANNAGLTTSYNIHIAKGTYYPTGAQSSANRDSAFAIFRTGLRVYGGYPTGGGTRNVTSNTTVLSGDIGAAGNINDNSYHVVVMTGIPQTGDTSFLDGLIITGGNANGSNSKIYTGDTAYQNQGGGLWINRAGGNVMLLNCNIRYNNGIYGGGMYRDSSIATLQSTAFQNNHSDYGGAIYIASSALGQTLDGCIFDSNSATMQGGGIFANTNSYFNLLNCVFTQNTTGLGSGASGGAIYTLQVFWATRCSFLQNSAPTGGAIYTKNGASIDSSIFTGNHATGSDGGAIAFTSSEGVGANNLLCSNTSFTANTALNDGGAIADKIQLNYSHRPTNCTFTKDSARRGGALFIHNYLNMSGCSFKSNYASARGGACYNLGSLSDITNSEFRGNRADTAGGAVFAEGVGLGGKAFTNTLFSGNSAGQEGGAIAASKTKTFLVLTNCTMVGDSAVNGNGVYADSSSFKAKNCIFWEGTGNTLYTLNNSVPVITYSTIPGGYTGAGNITSNPLFANPLPTSVAPDTGGDYTLTPCSPVINIGQNTGLYAGVLDAAGNTRLTNYVVDMGAYEFQPSSVAGILSGADSVCTGTSKTIISTIAGGTWSNLGGWPRASVSASGVVTGLTAGPADTIRYTVVVNGCPVSVDKIVNVLASPAQPTATLNSGAPMCPGTEFILSVNPTHGTWTIDDTSITSLRYFALTAAYFRAKTPGTTFIYYTRDNGNGCTATDTVSVTIAGLPVATITGGDSLCTGTTAQLSNVTPNGVWGMTTNSTGFTVSSTGLLTAMAAGNGYVTYTITDALGCSGTDSQSIAISTRPNSSLTISGNTITVAEPNASYEWFLCNANGTKTSTGIHSRSFTAQSSGSYCVVTDNGFCTSESVCYPMIVSAVSNISTQNWNLYPNPTTGNATLQTGSITAKNIIVQDITGKLLLKVKPTGPEATLDVKSFAYGLYLVTVTDSEGNAATLRLTVTK